MHHECQCNECKKFHHHHNQCNCHRNNHQHNQCNCHNNHYHSFKDSCHHEKHGDFFENRTFCDDRFAVRLGGLKHGMAFRLRQLLDCDIKINVVEENEKIHGKLVIVGTDFVEVLVNNEPKQRKQKCRGKMQSRIIPFESIKFIENLD